MKKEREYTIETFHAKTIQPIHSHQFDWEMPYEASQSDNELVKTMQNCPTRWLH